MSAHVAAAALSPRILHGVADDADPHLRIDGTAVVVDISGFTTLSEQLAAAGREGTEQLIATLSRIFTVLLPVTDDGGDVVKFAGDALFILFTGDEHARHAVHAAWNMNRVLTAIGDIHLPSARAKLRMSVGVHTGTYELLLTGVDHVSAILTGAATSRVLDLQSAADAGRILVSDETAALLPATQVAKEESAPDARRLLKAGSVATASLMALSVGRTEAAGRFLPRAFAERPDLLGAEPDHRWAAIGFVQVSGVPGAPGDDDVERMARLTALVEEAAADAGVTLLDVDPAVGGYRYFLTAGAPTTVEDPEGRLLTAVQRIVSSESPYSLRAGVASGRVFAGFVGATYRQTYTVMGDVTNLAARLTARAAVGTVLVAREALERSAVQFEAEDGGELALKGKAKPTPTAVITRPGTRAESAGGSIPFIGRDAEVRRMIALAKGAADGFGGALTIVGGAGTGKTRILARALEGIPMRVVRADGDRYAVAAPYRTLQTLLRPLLGIPAEAAPAEAGASLADHVARRRPALTPWLPLLAPAVGAEVDPTDAVDSLDDEFRQERSHTVLGRLLEDLLPTPTCVVIDDAQWVDQTSAAALAHVLSGDTPHAVLLTRREHDGGLEVPGQKLVLEPLSDEESIDLIESVVGRPLLPSDLAPLISRADGNPLYLIELAAGVSSGSEALGIEQLIGERIDALTEQERSVVRRAAVLGWGVPIRLFIRCVGPIELAETDGVAGFLELLQESVRFRNELFRDVALEQLTFQARRELHRAVAAVLVAEPELAGASAEPMLVMHYEAAGDWANALASATRAGADAAEQGAVEDALHAYRVAVAAARRIRPAPAGLAELWESLAGVCVATGRAGEGLIAYESARKLTKDAVVRARIDLGRAYALNVLGRPDEAAGTLKSARRAATAAGDSGRGMLAAIAVTDAGVSLRQSHWADALRLSSEAMQLLEADAHRSTEDQKVLADAYRYHDIAAGELTGDEAMTHLQRALELYDELGDELSRSKVLNVLGARAYYRGEWSTAAGLYADAQSAAERAGDVIGAAIESMNAAEILADQGRADEARVLAKAAKRVFVASDNPYLAAFITGYAGRADLRAGEVEVARAAFAEAERTFASLDEADAQRDMKVRGVEADLAAGEIEAARAAALSLDADSLPGSSRSQLLRHRARLAEIDGDADVAIELAQAAVDAAGAAPFDHALALALLGRLTGTDGAPLITQAQTTLEELGVVDIPALLSAPQSSHSPSTP